MKIHDCAQGEAEWAVLRAGKITASEADHLLTPEFKERTGETPKTFLYRKLAEVLYKGPLPGFSSWDTEQGKELEDEARRWYAFTSEDSIRNVGFCEHDNGRAGCSPDALLGEDGGLEIKAPAATNHVRYLMEGILPKDYSAQVHFSMYVTGRKWWRFLSFHRRFPKFILTVERDEEIIAKINAAVTGFLARLDEALVKLRSI